MTAIFRSESHATANSGFPSVCTPPTGHTAGDLLLLVVFSRNSLSPTITGAGGQTWTVVNSQADASVSELKLWYAIHNGTLTSVSATGSGTTLASLLAYRHVEILTTPFAGTSTKRINSGSGSPQTVPVITTTLNDVLRVICLGGLGSSGGSSFTGATGFTTQVNTFSSGANHSQILVGDQTQAVAGASPAETSATSPADVATHFIHIALAPRIPTAAAIDGTMTGLDGTVVGTPIAGIDEFAQIDGSMSGLTGSISAFVYRPYFTRPVKRYIWVSDLHGVRVNVLD